MTASSGSPPPEGSARRAMTDVDGAQALIAGSATGPGALRARRGHRRSPWRWFVAAFLALVLLGLGFFAYRGYRALERIERDPDLLVDYSGRPQPGLGTNYLVLASHNSSASAPADVIMLLHLNRWNDRAYLVPLPRDFYLPDGEGGQRGLQAIYSRNGAVGLQKVLEAAFDTRIDHVARVDYNGFIGVTSDLGGVVVDNPVETTTPAGIHFAQGPITVSGDQALAYVADDSSIPGRDQVLVQRQQSVLRAIVLKLLRPESFLNPVVLSSVLSSMSRHLSVDTGLTTPVIAQLATSLRLSRSSDIAAVQAPILGVTTGSDGNPATLPDPTRVRLLSTALRADTMDAYHAAHPG